jgi:Bacterial Ig-like domain (group 2).
MRITISDVKTSLGITNTYDIVNAIRNSNPNFSNYVPLATAENVAEIGTGILINQTVQNEFITSLVDRIGLVVIRTMNLQNPLKKFKKGAMPQGRTIEEIFTDITKGKKYDPFDAEETVFKREIPNVKTLFHERNRQDFYEQTIQDDSLKTAFISWGNFETFVSSIINAIYNSAEVEEYEYMKLLIDNYYSKGLFTIVPVTKPNTETAAREFVKKLRATATKMSLPNGSRDFNALAVRTRSDINDLHLIIDADLNAEVDVEVLAKAFNMNKTDFLGNVTVIDGFSSTGLEAVLIDREWYMVYDNLLKLETIRNPKGLYWNYFYHVWQTLSVSRFANAVAFVSGAVPKVTQVIVDPTILSVKAGGSFEYTAYIRVNDGQTYEPVWTVEGMNGTVVDAGTTIDSDGKLKVATNQTGQLSVKATVTHSTDKTVVGESIVTVIP